MTAVTLISVPYKYFAYYDVISDGKIDTAFEMKTIFFSDS